ncbi:MAG: hypothetical protein AB1411_06645 [Nitrospirota bacterium]
MKLASIMMSVSLFLHVTLLGLLGFVVVPDGPWPDAAIAGSPAERYLAGLNPEAQETMFEGTIEAVDWDSLSITVKTDFGRVLVLSATSTEALAQLSQGDRVRLEVDLKGSLQVRKLEPATGHRSQRAGPVRRSSVVVMPCEGAVA